MVDDDEGGDEGGDGRYGHVEDHSRRKEAVVVPCRAGFCQERDRDPGCCKK